MKCENRIVALLPFLVLSILMEILTQVRGLYGAHVYLWRKSSAGAGACQFLKAG